VKKRIISPTEDKGVNMQKIKCETKTTYRSKSTDKTYETEEEFLKHHSKEDLVTDVVVKVPHLDLFGGTNK
tara:strand:- start:636 stop:848 length:213 start_codon:yes stop_codon:yes gene_type:complete